MSIPRHPSLWIVDMFRRAAPPCPFPKPDWFWRHTLNMKENNNMNIKNKDAFQPNLFIFNNMQLQYWINTKSNHMKHLKSLFLTWFSMYDLKLCSIQNKLSMTLVVYFTAGVWFYVKLQYNSSMISGLHRYSPLWSKLCPMPRARMFPSCARTTCLGISLSYTGATTVCGITKKQHARSRLIYLFEFYWAPVL